MSTPVVTPDRSTEWSENSSVTSLFATDSDVLQSQMSSPQCDPHNLQVTVNVALASQVEMLSAENQKLKSQLTEAKQAPFRIEFIADDDHLVTLYTGFPSYEILVSFFTFLGPAVDKLNYWGAQPRRHRRRRTKLDSFNQFFLTLVKLKLNLNIEDLAFRFQISTSTISRYFITWIAFLYNELKEIPWFPTKEQVAGTLPYAFRAKYPTTVAIIDASEIFIETPSDLMLQSTSWSSYKHHNTLKFLVACTPNGSISFVSSVYLGSISDPTLTKECGFLQKLEGMVGISIMADRGFIIKDSLSKLGISLNLPPFLEGRGQLDPDELQCGRSIASLRIHVERAIGRLKQYKILCSVFPLKMARLANQIVTVCAYLTNFHLALVPTPDPVDIELPSQGSPPCSDQEESENESIDITNSECSSVVCDLDIIDWMCSC